MFYSTWSPDSSSENPYINRAVYAQEFLGGRFSSMAAVREMLAINYTSHTDRVLARIAIGDTRQATEIYSDLLAKQPTRSKDPKLYKTVMEAMQNLDARADD